MTLDIPAGDFDGYIFDCDGTLADSMPIHYRAWCAVLENQAVEFPEALFYECGGVPTEKIIELLNERHGTHLDPVETARRKEELYVAMLDGLKPIEPVVDFVHQFYGKVPLAVASGGRRSVVTRTLTCLGIVDRFQVLVCAEDYVNGKPAPDPFLQAARALNLPPERCLAFEDTHLGIQSAEAAGMKWVLVPQPVRTPLVG